MSNHKDVPIRVFQSPKVYEQLDRRDEAKIAELIRREVLAKTDAEYFSVNVRVQRNEYEQPDYIVAYLLRKDIYLAEVVRIDVTPDYETKDVFYDYEDTEEEEEDTFGTEEEDPSFEDLDLFEEGEISSAEEEEEETYGYDFVVATPVPSIPTAKAAIEHLSNLLTKAGYKVKMLLGTEASVANYQLYLTSGLKGFVNVGHGNKSGIVLYDGVLSYTWFKDLTLKSLKPAVVYFNSCQVFNDPLKASVMKAGARTYIGGIVNLLIGKSEEVCKCFWEKAVVSAVEMGPALKKCETALYPYKDAHGIAGDIGLFRAELFRRENVMWIPGHSVEVQYPERLSLLTRYGFFLRLRGKPFQRNWLHAAMPTLTVEDSQRMRAGAVMLRFRTGPGAWISKVHVYDGEKNIGSFDVRRLESAKFVTRRFPISKAPLLNYGLTVSIEFTCGEAANLPPNKLLLDLVGVGFEMLVKVKRLPQRVSIVTEKIADIAKVVPSEKPEAIPVPMDN